MRGAIFVLTARYALVRALMSLLMHRVAIANTCGRTTRRGKDYPTSTDVRKIGADNYHRPLELCGAQLDRRRPHQRHTSARIPPGAPAAGAR